MTLRKLLALLVCILMLLAAVGCGEAPDTDDDDNKSSKKSKTSVSTSVTGESTTTHTGKTTTSREKDTTTQTTTTTAVQGGTAARLPDDELILGDWEADVALGRVMEAMAQEDAAMQQFDFADLTITMAYRFDADGTATVRMNADEQATADLTAAFLDGMDAYLQTLIDEGGYASTDALCKAMNCSSLDELREMLADMMAQMIVSGINEITETVSYRFADGYLFFSNEDGEQEQYNYTLTATRLLLDFTGEVSEEDAWGVTVLMPLTFKKV